MLSRATRLRFRTAAGVSGLRGRGTAIARLVNASVQVMYADAHNLRRARVSFSFQGESKLRRRFFNDQAQPSVPPGANCTIKFQLLKTVVVPDEPTGETESHVRLHDRKTAFPLQWDASGISV